MIPVSVRENLFKYIGEEADAFILSSTALLEKYTKTWQLSHLTFMPTDTVNLLFSCHSALYGPCVLKICILGLEVATEINCLRAYDNQGYVKLWEYETADHILLLAHVNPGSQLWEVSDYQQRASLFATTLKNLQMIPTTEKTYPTYEKWLKKVRQNLIEEENLEEFIIYLDEALKTYKMLQPSYPNTFLLHGDLHQENLLLNNENTYTIIDPKGVVDMPVMETARFLLNEMPCETKKLQKMIAIISEILEIPTGDLIKSLFIDVILANSWTMEEHVASKEIFEQNKQQALTDCKFIAEFLHKNQSKEAYL